MIPHASANASCHRQPPAHTSCQRQPFAHASCHRQPPAQAWACGCPASPTAAPAPTSLQAGMQLLREHVFIHLEHPADKLNLLLAMLNKLFALASGECCEDNPDALTHHEVCMEPLLLVVS